MIELYGGRYSLDKHAGACGTNFSAHTTSNTIYTLERAAPRPQNAGARAGARWSPGGTCHERMPDCNSRQLFGMLGDAGRGGSSSS